MYPYTYTHSTYAKKKKKKSPWEKPFQCRCNREKRIYKHCKGLDLQWIVNYQLQNVGIVGTVWILGGTFMFSWNIAGSLTYKCTPQTICQAGLSHNSKALSTLLFLCPSLCTVKVGITGMLFCRITRPLPDDEILGWTFNMC